VPFSFFSDRSDWRCDLSSLVRFFAMLTVSHSLAPIATPCGFQTDPLPAKGRSCINKQLQVKSLPNRNGGRNEPQEDRSEKSRSDRPTQRGSQKGRRNAQTPSSRAEGRENPHASSRCRESRRH